MINGKRVLALIPARGGSKGIKNKNIALLGGQPLIAYTIETAIASGVCDKVMVSTDSEQIAEISKKFGAEVPFLRPAKLANDQSKTIECVVHCIEMLKNNGEEYDVLLLLQPTQPFRRKQSIIDALMLFEKINERSVASVVKVKEHPILMRMKTLEHRAIPLFAANSTVRRQEFSDVYKVNGAIYINKIRDLTEETSFNDNEYCIVMDKYESVDIDEEEDLLYAEFILQHGKLKSKNMKDVF